MVIEAGTVVAFDRDVGLGEVEFRSGDRLLFHTTAIADGTRDIRVGQVVSCQVRPIGLGTVEVAELVKV